MKKRILLLSFGGTMAFFTLQSDSGGPGGNYTGSHGGNAGCYSSSCHGNTPTTGMKIGIELDSAGVPVTMYTPGMSYTIKITDTNTTTNSLPKFGFEFSVVKGSGSSSSQAGSFGTAPAGTQIHASSTLSIWGHNTRLNPISGTGGTNTIYADSIGWTAPAAGSGTITMYTVINAVNNNGNDDAGDKWNIKNVAFAERASTNAVSTVNNQPSVRVFPNPVSSNMHITLPAEGNYTISVYNMAGQVVATQSTVATGNATVAVNSSNWATGTYNVVVTGNGSTSTTKVVKQ